MSDPLPSPAWAPPDEMTVAEVARRMGYCTEQVYRWVRDERVPCVRVGSKGRIRFSREQMARLYPIVDWYGAHHG